VIAPKAHTQKAMIAARHGDRMRRSSLNRRPIRL